MNYSRGAQLAYFDRVGDHTFFRIGYAADFNATLSEFKDRVPATARRYDAQNKTWRIDSRYEAVLGDLFDDYGQASRSAPYGLMVPTPWGKSGRRKRGYGRRNFHGKRIPAKYWVALVALLIAGVWFISTLGQSRVENLGPDNSAGVALTSFSQSASEGIPTSAQPSVKASQISAGKPTNTVPASVMRVVDGDTIDVSITGVRHRVRYIGMDTPERDEEYFSLATQENRLLLDGQTIYLEKDVSETDRYGRLLRYIWLADGRMVNEELVAMCYAVLATYPPDVKYVDRFRQAQQDAMMHERGFWADSP